MRYKDDYARYRREPLEKEKMSIRKLRKRIKKANGIGEVGDALRIFLCQFSKLELGWIQIELEHNIMKKYKIK